MITPCEIRTESGAGCEQVASGWCRVCDRPTCDRHRRVVFRGPERIERCQQCIHDADLADAAAEAAYRAALEDITASIRALRRAGSTATEVATKHELRASRLRPWRRRTRAIYSIRYWPVGTFTWLQSGPGGFGDHELLSLGIEECETVVNERGEITRRDEVEIVRGRAVLAQLVSAPTATVAIAEKLRAYLR